MRLITIPMSHYCEKARWALERLDFEYREDRHLQGPHYLQSYRHGTPFVPILVDGDSVIIDSSKIIEYLDGQSNLQNPLIPADTKVKSEMDEMCKIYDEELGVFSRLWVYHGFFSHPRKAIEIAGQGVPGWQKAMGNLAFPFLRMFITRRLTVNDERVTKGIDRCREIFDDVERRLADGRPYLLGDEFTSADLTFASMAAPFLCPKEYGIELPRPTELPEAMRPVAQSFIDRPGGAFALRLFAQDRGPPQAKA